MEPNPRIGVAYRPDLRVERFRAPATVDYLEMTAEHFLDLRGRVRDDLDALKATFPIVVHDLGLWIGSADGVDPAYLERLARLIAYVDAPWWSDHLAFAHAAGIQTDFFVSLRRDEAATPFAVENLALPSWCRPAR